MDTFDLLLLGFAGVAVASAPLAWVWVGRARGAPGGRLRRLAWVTAFLTFDLVVFGGFTRLTDSDSAVRTGRAATRRPIH